jgi:hypothetical protein
MKAGAISDLIFDFSCLIMCIFVAVPDATHVNVAMMILKKKYISID